MDIFVICLDIMIVFLTLLALGIMFNLGVIIYKSIKKSLKN